MTQVFEIFSLLNSIIFALISFLHVYWAFGGKSFFLSALPKDRSGKLIFSPGPIACLVVASGLLLFTAINLLNFFSYFPKEYQNFNEAAFFLIALIFGLRAIGDLSYVGFFKKVRSGVFAKWDTLLYSPLCLFLSLSHLILGQII